MSRTLKDRPHYVRRNDPASRGKAKHQHIIHLHEKVGEYEETVFAGGLAWNEEENHYDKLPPRTVTRDVYRYWSEVVPCTLHIPSSDRLDWAWCWQGSSTVEEMRTKKHCYYDLDYYVDDRSGKFWKQKTNRAIRAAVNQQLREARYAEPEDIDINSDTMYDSRGWWDW